MRLSIRWKFILSIGLTLLATYLAVLTWDYWWQKDRARQEVQAAVTQRAQSFASDLNSRLEAAMQVAETLATSIERRPPTNEQALDALLQEASRTAARPLTAVAIYEPNSDPPNSAPFIVATRLGPGPGGRGPGSARGGPNRGGSGGGGRGPGARGQDPDRRGGGFAAAAANLEARMRRGPLHQLPLYAIPANEHRAAWIEPGTEGVLSQQTVYTTPIQIGDVFHGVVAIALNPDELFGFGGRGGPPPPPSLAPPSTTTMPTSAPLNANRVERQTTLINGAGRIILNPDPDAPANLNIEQWARQNEMPELADELQAALKDESDAVHLARVRNVPVLLSGASPNDYYWVALAPVQAVGWVAAAAIPESEHLDPLLQHLQQRALFLTGGLVVLLMVVAFVSIRVSRPIEKMAAAVNQLATGNLDTQVRGVHSRDELGQLAGAFNSMTRQLKQHVAALTEQTAARQSVEAELRIARQIQSDLLPRKFPPFPDRTEFDLFAMNVPAKHVAGDFYDFFFAPNDLLTIAIADVAGKGMPAALLMAVTRTIIRNLAMEGMSPRQIAERANTMLVEDVTDSRFVTLFLCQYNTRTGAMSYVNAGHPHPYRFSATEPPTPFGEVTGAILGVSPNGADWAFEQREAQVQPGETILFYTDGVTEARAPDNTMLRDAGLIRLIEQHKSQGVDSLCASFVADLDRYQNGRQSDDITLVALHRRG